MAFVPDVDPHPSATTNQYIGVTTMLNNINPAMREWIVGSYCVGVAVMVIISIMVGVIQFITWDFTSFYGWLRWFAIIPTLPAIVTTVVVTVAYYMGEFDD